MIMSHPHRVTVVAVFEDRESARRALDDLHAAGFSEEEVGLMTRDHVEGPGHVETHSQGSKADEGAAAGVIAGAGVGGLWAIGIAAGLLPAIGPVIAGGIFTGLLASAAVGAAVGGVVGALIGLGIPEEQARVYEQEVREGRTLVTVHATSPEAARAVLERHGAVNIHTAVGVAEELRDERHAVYSPAGTERPVAGRTDRIPDEIRGPHTQRGTFGRAPEDSSIGSDRIPAPETGSKELHPVPKSRSLPTE